MLHLPGEPQSVRIQAAVSVISIVRWRKESGSAELCEEPQGKNYPAASYSSLLPADRGRATLQSHRLLRWASQDDKHLRQAEKVPEGLFIHRHTITEPRGE